MCGCFGKGLHKRQPYRLSRILKLLPSNSELEGRAAGTFAKTSAPRTNVTGPVGRSRGRRVPVGSGTQFGRRFQETFRDVGVGDETPRHPPAQ